ncbi:MAG TPA: hypothetical protein ENF21_04095 [Bacteroidetes bacterium]|nr:hypothetical protein [Bacteroidota bacterium]
MHRAGTKTPTSSTGRRWKLDKHIWSLVIFGLLAQSGAGIWLTTELIMLNPSFAVTQETEHLVRKIYLTVFIILIVSLIISFFHLGYPRHFFHALNNLGSSWLSREILALSLFLFFLALVNLSGYFPHKMPQAPVLPRAGCTLSAVFLLASMSKLYMLETVPAWNTFHTPSAFVLTALLAGTGFVLFAGLIPEPQNTWGRIFSSAAFVLILLNLINQITWPGMAGFRNPVFMIEALTGALAGILYLYLTFSQSPPGIRIHGIILLPALAFLLAAVSEILARIQFFNAFSRTGV